MATVLSTQTLEASISRLCLSCGFCCDGTLFGRVPLEGDEAARLEEAGLTVLRSDGRAWLRQRCCALEGRACRVYEARPGTCRKFECLLVAALRAGEVDVEEAEALVARVRASLAAGDTAQAQGALARHFLGRSGSGRP